MGLKDTDKHVKKSFQFLLGAYNKGASKMLEQNCDTVDVERLEYF